MTSWKNDFLCTLMLFWKNMHIFVANLLKCNFCNHFHVHPRTLSARDFSCAISGLVKSLLVLLLFFFQYNFIEHTQVQLTFTKDNLQQNENYNLKLTKKKPNTIKTLVVTKIKWECNQLSKQNFILFKRDEKTDHFVLNSFSRPVVQEIYFSRLILSRARETNSLKM